MENYEIERRFLICMPDCLFLEKNCKEKWEVTQAYLKDHSRIRSVKKDGKTVIAFAGCVTPDARACNDCGIDAFVPILRAPCTLAEAMEGERARQNLTNTAEQAFRLFCTRA